MQNFRGNKSTRAAALRVASLCGALTLLTALPLAAQMSVHPADQNRQARGQGRPEGPGGRPGEGILPPGPWWNDPQVATAIGLTDDQKSRIQDLFAQSRVQLAHLHGDLEVQQATLEPLLNANPVDQGKAMASINKIADLRAELEKSNAKMLLQIRAVLNADQWTKLRSTLRPPPPGQGSGDRRRNNPGE